MILLIGHGYIGEAFAAELIARRMDFEDARHGDFLKLEDYSLVINAAAYIPKPSVSICDLNPEDTILGNLLFPSELASRCREHGTTLMHISTGCLYDDKLEYCEDDTPLRGFAGHCGMYVGTKLMAEKVVRRNLRHYILRIRLPFDEFDNPRNYLSKLASYPQVYDHVNSLTHRGDFVKAALDLFKVKAPWGTYHVANPHAAPASVVIERMMEAGIIEKRPQFIPGPCRGCVLSVDKLLSTGVKIRSVSNAINDAIANWKKA